MAWKNGNKIKRGCLLLILVLLLVASGCGGKRGKDYYEEEPIATFWVYNSCYVAEGEFHYEEDAIFQIMQDGNIKKITGYNLPIDPSTGELKSAEPVAREVADENDFESEIIKPKKQVRKKINTLIESIAKGDVTNRTPHTGYTRYAYGYIDGKTYWGSVDFDEEGAGSAQIALRELINLLLDETGGVKEINRD